MPIRLEWGNPEKTLVLETIGGDWSLQDAYRALDDGQKLLLEVEHRVDVIVDMTTAHFPDINWLSAMGHIERTKSANQGLLIVVQANRYLRSITQVAQKLAPKAMINIRFVNTLDDAYMLLQNAPA